MEAAAGEVPAGQVSQQGAVERPVSPPSIITTPAVTTQPSGHADNLADALAASSGAIPGGAGAAKSDRGARLRAAWRGR